MKKNVPITQRAEVKTNSKNKVEEPLLNVGPAGVYGNNQTRKTPSPAKQKAKKKIKSPAKQKKVTNTEVFTSTSAGEKIKIAGKEKQRIRTAKDVGVSQAKVNKYNLDKYGTTNPTKEGKIKGGGNLIGTGEFEKDTEIKGKPKEKTTSSTETVRVRDTGDSQTALSRRQTIRGGKVGTRVEYKGKVKAARAKFNNMSKAEKKAKGGRSAYMRKVKNEAKEVRANKNSKLGAAAAKGAKAQADENKSSLSGQTNNVKSASRDQDKGDLTPAQQAAKQAARLEAASNKKASTAFTDNAGDTSTEVKDFSKITAAGKMAPGFFKGKSPLKMGYFKNKK